jgi:transcriptional regulator with XRE-family HTH domain
MEHPQRSFYIGPNLRRWRDYFGLSQKEMASLAQMEQPNYSNIESNKQRATYLQVELWAKGLGVTPEQLMHEDTQPVYHIEQQHGGNVIMQEAAKEAEAWKKYAQSLEQQLAEQREQTKLWQQQAVRLSGG